MDNSYNNKKNIKKEYKSNKDNNYINPFNEQKLKIMKSNINLKKDIKYNNNSINEKNIIFSTNHINRNNSFNEYAKEINITLFDYFCPGKNVNKKKMISLFNSGKSFYRKRMDIVLVFSHLLVTEKLLLKNSYKYVYPSCREIELLFTKE